ncbi:MAG: DUF3298 and DUF4163 domain-containing protein [Clostridiaceae bacterium]|nr:DUF3298 and DUF4163 domain-containing protein [Eubacteriales bacterium]
MDPSNFRASIVMRKIERSFAYDGTPMLALSIRYPTVTLPRNPSAQKSIDGQIQAQVNAFYHYAADDLYRQAVAAYKDAQENGFPFHRYDAILQYTITYNQRCHLSLYRDQYEYTGGAHGNTVRASDTWSLETGRNLPLYSFFPAGRDYRAFLISQIIKQADVRMQQEPGIFFENYRALIVQYFNGEHYYLTPAGLVIYYQQYEIAPYVTGIVPFTIPYATLNWQPSCRMP